MIYYLLSKDDFAALYKFGEVGVKVGASAESDDPREAVKKLFSASDSFEYAQERLIVCSEKGTQETIRMVDVKGIFPLDDISRNLFMSQFNPAIIFREPVFQDIAEDFLKNTVLERTTVSGINALRAVLGLEKEKDDELIRDIIKGKTFLRRYKYFEVPLDDRTPYSMLIAYNRYQHYPKDSRGFFYDAADCFMYGHMFRSLAKPEEFLGYDRDAVARYCSNFHRLLDSIPVNAGFRSIVATIEGSDQRIKNAIAQVYGSIRFISLYFYAKEYILADQTVSYGGIKLLLYIRKEYPSDFSKLVTLLGGFLGYSWIYDRLYEFQNCKFLSIHHNLDDLVQLMALAESETVFEDETPDTTSEKEFSTLKEVQQIPDGQSDVPFSKEASSNEETTMDKTIVQEEASPDKPIRKATKQTNEETPASVLDIENITDVVLKNCGKKRKEDFRLELRKRYNRILEYVKEGNENELRLIYPRLDNSFSPKKDRAKLDAFVKVCLGPQKENTPDQQPTTKDFSPQNPVVEEPTLFQTN